MSDKRNIVLMLGGISSEREISKASGKGVYNALIKLGHNVTIIDPGYGANQKENPESYFGEDYAKVNSQNYLHIFDNKCFNNTDLVFIILHGQFGEDGIVQSLLELKQVKYTGSGVLSSSLAMDKIMTKCVFEKYGVPTPHWITASKNDNINDIINISENEISYPCFVKPNASGSSIGMTFCANKNELLAGINEAFKYADIIFIEKFIEGREFTIGVLQDTSLPALEIKPKHKFYDYDCKYTKGMTEYEVPAVISSELAEKLKTLTLKAFNALGCKGFARVDFRVDENNEAFCLEVNTLPGMTETSLVPKMAKAVGMSYEELVQKIIEISL